MITSSSYKFNAVTTIFATVAEKAGEDIRKFFLECTEPEILSSMKSDPNLQSLRKWNDRCKKIYAKIRKKHDNTFPVYTDAFQFLEDLLTWLEDREAKLEWPWKLGLSRREITDKDISGLLNLFKHTFLDGLCTPHYPSMLNKVVDEIPADIWLLRYFLEYMGMSRNLDGHQWDVQLVTVGPKNVPVLPAHFLSWLAVDDKNKILYILYNKEAISFGAKDTYEVITRLETVFLHEFGHAINHLEWYKEKLKTKQPLTHEGPEWISTPALFELEAWAYAFAFRGIVKSIRSWITRIVKESDDEWLSP